jgi:hypothetical protein
VEVLLLLLFKSIDVHAAVLQNQHRWRDGLQRSPWNVVDSNVGSQQAKPLMQSKTELEPGQNLDRLRVVKSLPMQVKGKPRYHRQADRQRKRRQAQVVRRGMAAAMNTTTDKAGAGRRH